MKHSYEKSGKNAIIIDTSALVAGFDPFAVNEEQYTVPKVIGEITGDTMSWFRFKTAIENGRVKIRTPEKASVEKAKTFASAVGDFFLLSKTDLQVLALALELKIHGYSPLIATDDYSMQNVASEMNIGFAALSTFGIRRRLRWIRYCPACHKKYPANYKSLRCEVCGTRIKRKPLTESSVDRKKPQNYKANAESYGKN